MRLFTSCQIHNISYVWDWQCSALLLGIWAPQPRDGIVGQDYHVRWLVLCSPTSMVTLQVMALSLQVLQYPRKEQAASYCQWRWLILTYCGKVRAGARHTSWCPGMSQRGMSKNSPMTTGEKILTSEDYACFSPIVRPYKELWHPVEDLGLWAELQDYTVVSKMCPRSHCVPRHPLPLSPDCGYGLAYNFCTFVPPGQPTETTTFNKSIVKVWSDQSRDL